MTATDALLKPDMRAVLSRTHVQVGLHGFLLPVLEAISNAMHGVEERFGEDGRTNGTVDIHFHDWNNPSKFKVSVSDNGAGLNDENYRSFKTPFTGHKLRLKGRGFGRFIAFKVFARVVYESRYAFLTAEDTRSFRFNIEEEREFALLEIAPEFTGTGLRVTYDQPLTTWHDLIRQLDKGSIANEIGGHFLPYFLYRWLPEITIRFDQEAPIDIRSRFGAMFVQFDAGSISVEIDGSLEQANYSLARVRRSQQFKSHCLLLSAADRIVGSPRDLSAKIGSQFFADEDGEKYVVIAVVRSEAFENRLNDARTGINVSPRVLEDIFSKISDVIQSKELSQIEKIKDEQSSDLEGALKENPILRLGLRGRSVKEYVAAKPNNWSSEEFVSDLAIERYRATNDLAKQIVSAAANAENYEREIKNIVEQIDESKKEALAEYVIHRRNIIELVEAARKFQGDGRHAPEDAIHDLVFKRFNDNVSLNYFEHNLWLVDDALAFMPYISSDRTLHGGRRRSGDKVTDLLFFDDSMVLGDENAQTLTVVEFKRPSRNDYVFGSEKNDPILQVINTVSKATAAGGLAKTDGTHFSFAGAVRKIAYIIADLTPSLIGVLQQHDFINDWNPRIFVRYHANQRVFIQAFGYETLLENAKKRNQAFFSVLFGQ
ncbi:sensor histidine kinase [Bradyrhizobium sp. 166]|uniref:ATP-binding protein n=1 Tax=Bradyrhizobium sp. 166 TaxID=2782638 RepID=UPI001FF711D2|nr:ATP-binding protein [Bradyrhizobium sp. 166]MCK1602609.1 sensor histidine kinase [Bradyrhizobium sp. 166]